MNVGKVIPFCITALLSVVFLFSANPAHATRVVSITSDTSLLNGWEDMTVTASMSGFTNGETIYIKGAFYKDGTSDYFGQTDNNGNWIVNNDTTTSQKQIIPNNWDGTLKIRGDFNDSDYKGEGDYKLKVGFYYITSGGKLSDVNWSTNSIDVKITNPPPTATPTPSPTNTPVPPSPTSKPTSTPTPKLTTVPTSKISPTLDPQAEGAEQTTASGLQIDPSPTTEVLGMSTQKDQVQPMPYILIIAGVVLFVVCGILLFLQWKKSQLTL